MSTRGRPARWECSRSPAARQAGSRRGSAGTESPRNHGNLELGRPGRQKTITWLGYLDSNQKQLNQNQPCCQLHHTPMVATGAGPGIHSSALREVLTASGSEEIIYR